MAAMVAGAAFADPEADVAISTFAGRAGTQWGVDLDNEGRSGFKNYASLDFQFSLFNSGSKSTEGEGIWAELSLDAGNNNDWDHYAANSWGVIGNQSSQNKFSLNVGTAKLHFYDFYVGLLSGNTSVGELYLPGAVRSGTGSNGHGLYLGAVGESKSQGLTLGYGDNKNIGVEVDFRSNSLATTGGTNYYNNDYGIAAEIKLLSSNDFATNLFSTVGASYAFNEKALALAGSAGYKLKIDDTFYVQPTAGYTTSWNDVSDISANKQVVAGGILLGWGDSADSNPGVYYLDWDNEKQITPGFSVNVYVPLEADTTIDIVPSFYTGSIVPNLTAAVFADINIPVSGGDLGFGIAGGLKYAVAVNDSVTVTPKVGARFLTGNSWAASGWGDPAFYAQDDNGAQKDLAGNNVAGANGSLNIKGGVDISGLINNTTFSVWYQSRDLLSDGNSKLGTINIGVEISL